MDSRYQHEPKKSHEPKSSNRVYVNPNFNKSQNIVQHNANSQSHKMHLNPAFSLQKVAATISQDAKIHINPNFISHIPQPRSQTLSHHDSATAPIASDGVVASSSNKPYTSVSSVNNRETSKPMIELTNYKTTICPAKNAVSSAKSRYSLIRNKVNVIKNNETNKVPEISKPMLKLTKYKSVRVSSMKKTFDINAPNRVNKYSLIKKRNTEILSIPKYKYQGSKYQQVPSKIAKPCKNESVSKYKIVKKSIPCPLFVKYGKCLRLIRGSCPYLHDKKHVSICRNLLKGRCFDENCLFSHELTSNRMPTCYFYLKGVCTKENCPYLHVKLTDDAGVCPEFLKGYCEMGDKCMKRHTFTRSINTKVQKKSKAVHTPHKPKLTQQPKLKTKMALEGADKPDPESRYYKQSDENKSSDNVFEIKPKRCKLGDLPSFIQL